MLPWDISPRFPIEFVCKHCGQVQPQSNGRIIICTCPEAVKEQAEERQRMENWRRQQAGQVQPRRKR